jgi:ATPase subunit of ABC transporter with duplicated ATPase domains
MYAMKLESERERQWQREFELQQTQQDRNLEQLTQQQQERQQERQQSRDQARAKRLKVEGSTIGGGPTAETAYVAALPSAHRGYQVEQILEVEGVDRALHADDRFRLLWPGLEAAGWKVVPGRGLENCKPSLVLSRTPYI